MHLGCFYMHSMILFEKQCMSILSGGSRRGPRGSGKRPTPCSGVGRRAAGWTGSGSGIFTGETCQPIAYRLASSLLTIFTE